MGQPGDEEVIAADERRLAGLGYAQELRRGMGAFSNDAPLTHADLRDLDGRGRGHVLDRVHPRWVSPPTAAAGR